MDIKLSEVNWIGVIIGAVIGLAAIIALTLIVNVGYGVVLGFQLRGAPPQGVLYAALRSLPFAILGLIWTLIGTTIGGRIAGKRSEHVSQLAGLIAGILMAIGLAIVAAEISVWALATVVIAIAGGWFGGFLAGRREDNSYDEVYA